MLSCILSRKEKVELVVVVHIVNYSGYSYTSRSITKIIYWENASKKTCAIFKDMEVKFQKAVVRQDVINM
jgi:hypothetical protein